MTRLLNPGDVLASQKQLRGQLLDRQGAISWRPGRELAAQLLLRLETGKPAGSLPPIGCVKPLMWSGSMAARAAPPRRPTRWHRLRHAAPTWICRRCTEWNAHQ